MNMPGQAPLYGSAEIDCDTMRYTLITTHLSWRGVTAAWLVAPREVTWKGFPVILTFKVRNWMSFRDEVQLSMVASRERQHGDRVPKVGKLQTRILPIGVIYGGNASGKTNLFQALNFMRHMVVEGTKVDAPIPVHPFQLAKANRGALSHFAIEVLIGDRVWEYQFSCDRKQIHTERLVVHTRAAQRVLFERSDNEIRPFPDELSSSTDAPSEVTVPKSYLEESFASRSHIDESHIESSFLDQGGAIASSRGDTVDLDVKFLLYAAHGTRANQLYLTNAVSQKLELFRPLFTWFQNGLELIAPDTRFQPFERFLDESNPLYECMNRALRGLDTGISNLVGTEVSLDQLDLPPTLRDRLEEDLKEGQTVRLIDDGRKERVVFSRKGDEIVAKRLVTHHRDDAGQAVPFDLRHESDGTQRVIDLLPAFIDLAASGSSKVFVIDEVGRSLHTLLIRQLIESYLDGCTHDSRTQLLITTHDVLLMDQDLFRRDEMWVTERKADGSSDLIAFSDYDDIRYDKDIRKSYLQGRLGGIPRLTPGNALVRTGSGACDGET